MACVWQPSFPGRPRIGWALGVVGLVVLSCGPGPSSPARSSPGPSGPAPSSPGLNSPAPSILGSSSQQPDRASTPPTAKLTVAAAASLTFAMEELLAEFRVAQPEIAVQAVYGSSGKFYAQIENRAPFDLFFSSDVDYPRRLAAQGLALDDNIFTYGVGQIVLWVPHRVRLAEGVAECGARTLLDPALGKIAIANPQHAPYGRATLAALESLGVKNAVEHRLVLGDNVAQTAQFVHSGSADAGILPLAMALAPALENSGSFWPIPLESHLALEHAALVTRWTSYPEAARQLREFMLSARGRAVLERHGFLRNE